MHLHTSSDAMSAANIYSFEAIPHLPYSPDLAPLDFYLFPYMFPNLKTKLRGRNFGSNEGAIDTVDELLMSIWVTWKKDSILKR